MGFIILAALIILATAAGVLGGRVAKAGNPTGPGQLIAVGSLIAGVVFLAILIGFESIDTVNPGNIGIQKSFGKLVGTTSNGMIVHSPWSTISSISVQNTLREYDMTGNNSAVTADSQPVYMMVQVNYQVLRVKAVPLWQSTGGDYVNRVLDPNVYQFTKATTANYTATEFAKNRDVIRQQIEDALTKAVQPKGIQINNVTLKNVQFTPALQAAIERTVEATQNAKQAQAQVSVVQAEAQQKVAKAKGDAEALLTNARAQAEANRLKNKTLTPLLIQQQAINALNPNVKVIVCPTGQVCIPNAVLATAGK